MLRLIPSTKIRTPLGRQIQVLDQEAELLNRGLCSGVGVGPGGRVHVPWQKTGSVLPLRVGPRLSKAWTEAWKPGSLDASPAQKALIQMLKCRLQAERKNGGGDVAPDTGL